MEFTKKQLKLRGYCAVEEAEEVFNWLQKHEHGALDFKDLAHLHAAVLQTLMASQRTVKTLPTDEFSAECLRQALLFPNPNSQEQ
jgi:hypothetical protein